ncbi:MAG: hypothetical protein JW938_05530 [Candidatus Omnitrophica bacterium]|nr:hypothetical protein [Candidatus Omnitrophota bacterium]
MTEGIRANIFIGMIINERLQEALDKCEPYNERFFRRNDPDYLQMTTTGDKSLIGKRLSRSVPLSEIDNIVNNIMSILKKICPDFYFDKNDVSVFTEIAIG